MESGRGYFYQLFNPSPAALSADAHEAVGWNFSSLRGSGVKVPGASLQRGPDPEGDERSGEEEHSEDPGLT